MYLTIIVIKHLFEDVKNNNIAKRDNIARIYYDYYDKKPRTFHKDFPKDLDSIFLPDSQSVSIYKQRTPSRERGHRDSSPLINSDQAVNKYDVLPHIDIFVSLRRVNRGLSSSNRNYSSNDICKLNCDYPSDKRCCKKVTDAFNTIVTGVASNLTPKKIKIDGGKTKSKNKKHNSTRCKNRKNKKSCKNHK
jgi:hypothetical protein